MQFFSCQLDVNVWFQFIYFTSTPADLSSLNSITTVIVIRILFTFPNIFDLNIPVCAKEKSATRMLASGNGASLSISFFFFNKER